MSIFVFNNLPPGLNLSPSIPGGLSVSNIANTSLSLSWNASTDDVAVTGYEYRIDGGSPVDVGNVLTANVTGLTTATAYSFEVRSYDGTTSSSWSSVVNATTTGVATQTFKILYTIDSDAGDTMSTTDTGTEGLSDFASTINGMTDADGNSYQITEINADSLAVSTAPGGTLDIRSYDIWITGSCNRVFTAGEQTVIDGLVRAGDLRIFGYSDSAMGSSGGYQNQFGQASRHSIGFPLWGWEVFVDQVDNVQTRTLPTGHFLGNGIEYQGEGTSPWVMDSNTNNHPTQGYPTVITPRPDQTPSHTQGVTFTGTVADLGYSTPGQGRILVLFDRQPFWNGGAGSDITQVDNRVFLQNCVQWLAGVIGGVPEFDTFVSEATGVYYSFNADTETARTLPETEVETLFNTANSHMGKPDNRTKIEAVPGLTGRQGFSFLINSESGGFGDRFATHKTNGIAESEIDYYPQASELASYSELYFDSVAMTMRTHFKCSSFSSASPPADGSNTTDGSVRTTDPGEAELVRWEFYDKNSQPLNDPERKGDVMKLYHGGTNTNWSQSDYDNLMDTSTHFVMGMATYCAHPMTYEFQNMIYPCKPDSNGLPTTERLLMPTDTLIKSWVLWKPNTVVNGVGQYDGSAKWYLQIDGVFNGQPFIASIVENFLWVTGQDLIIESGGVGAYFNNGDEPANDNRFFVLRDEIYYKSYVAP